MKKKNLPFLIGGIVVALLGITGIVLASTGLVGRIIRDPSGRAIDTLPPPPPPRTVTIAAVGDIMMGSDYMGSGLPPQDGELLFKDAAPLLRAADIAFGNLEGPITTAQGCTKSASKPTAFAFRCPPHLAKNLLTAGFDVMGLANNHARDFGYAGTSETKRILDSLGIKYSSKDGEIAEFTVDSLRVALIAFSAGSAPRSILNIDLAREEVESLASRYDILIVSFHGGTEGTKALHTRNEFENLYGEPRGNVIQFAHTMIDAGADVVIGHGPHVPRGMEVYKGKIIAYSLGNFCTYRCMQLAAELGYAPLLVVEVDSVGNFLRGEIHSFRQFSPGGPTKDSTQAVFQLMRSLSVADFGSSAPLFAENLNFYPPADSGLSEEAIKALRDSLEQVSIVEPDTITPKVNPKVDSFLTARIEESKTEAVDPLPTQEQTQPIGDSSVSQEPPKTGSEDVNKPEQEGILPDNP